MRWLATFAVIALLGGCGSGAPADKTLTVFAAASLSEVFQATAQEQRVTARFNFAGSPTLVRQLQEGAKADVLATADRESMEEAERVGVLQGPARPFATNRLEVVVPTGNPAGIETLTDLARAGVKVALADPSVPAGRYAAEALAKAGVTVRPVTSEESVRGVLNKVTLGEVDAGIVYVTDAQSVASGIERITIPDEVNVTASYFVAVVRGTPDQAAAAAFRPSNEVLARFGFLPA